MVKKDLSKSNTIRIDLIPDGLAAPPPPPPPPEPDAHHPVSELTRMNWRADRSVPSYVARSRYQELLQSVYDGALITDLAGGIVDANVRAVEFFQYERNDLCRMTLFDLISGAHDTLMQTLWESLEHDRYVLIHAYGVRKDGSSFPAEVAVNKLRLEEMRLCFFVRDITLRRQAEERLLTEHYAIENAATGVVIAALDARIEYANPAFAALLGREDPATLVDQDLAAALGDAATIGELVAHAKQDPQTWVSEVALKAASGEDIVVQVAATCSRNPEGEPLGIVFSFVDISDQKRTEAELVTARTDLQEEMDRRTEGFNDASRKLADELAELRRENEQLRQQLAQAQQKGS